MVILLVLNSAAKANWSGNGALAGYCRLIIRFLISRAILRYLAVIPGSFYVSDSGWRAEYTICPREAPLHLFAVTADGPLQPGIAFLRDALKVLKVVVFTVHVDNPVALAHIALRTENID